MTCWVTSVDWPMATSQTSAGWASGPAPGDRRSQFGVQRQPQPVAEDALVTAASPGVNVIDGAQSKTWPVGSSSK